MNAEPANDHDLVERLARLHTGDVSDGLRRLGLSPCGVDIRPLNGFPQLVGTALTVTYADVSDKPGRRLDFRPSIHDGTVLVLGNGGRLDAAVWGGGRSAEAMRCGARGVVADGAVRDVEEHLDLGLPVAARGTTVVSGSASGVAPVAVDETLTLDGVQVTSGDLLLCDRSGLVVIPRHVAEDCLREAEARASASTVTW